jgi:hypothetical protein
MANAAFFLESTYEEAYDLLIETRDYIENRIPEVRQHASPAYKMVLSVETMRLTTRLTQVMAWLLTQKAVYLEEMSPQQASKHAYRLGGQKICLEPKARVLTRNLTLKIIACASVKRCTAISPAYALPTPGLLILIAWLMMPNKLATPF